MSKLVLLQIKNGVATVVLNRPEKRNALNEELLALLCETIEKITSDDNVRVVIITGNGSAFCSGIDLNSIKTEILFNSTDNKKELPYIMANCRKPIIGAINGVAITGGLEIALNCDFLVASSNAYFIDTHAHLGIHPGWGVSQLLQQAIGQRRAKQMSFTCKPISAQTAYKWGLVNEIVPPKQLIDRASAIADEICKNRPEVLASIKKLIENRNRMSHEASLVLEREGFEQFVTLNLKS